MDYSDLNNLLSNLDIDNTKNNDFTVEKKENFKNIKTNDKTNNSINMNSLQRSLELYNNNNNITNNINYDRLPTNNISFQEKNKDPNQLLNERGFTPCASIMPIGNNKDMKFERFTESSRNFNE